MGNGTEHPQEVTFEKVLRVLPVLVVPCHQSAIGEVLTLRSGTLQTNR